MAKSSKGVMKSLGEKLMGGMGGKGSSSNKDEGVKAPPPKKKTQEASPEVEAMEIDTLISSGATRGPGKGKSLLTLRESMKPLDKVKKMFDGEEVSEEGEEDDIDFVTDEYDITKCHENVLFSSISRYA